MRLLSKCLCLHKHNRQTTLFPQTPKNYLSKYKRLIVLVLAVIITIAIILVLTEPIIPIKNITQEQRTRTLAFDSQFHGTLFSQNLYSQNLYYPSYISVTNLDNQSGTFSVVMVQTLQGYSDRGPTFTPENSTTITMSIDAGTSQNFSVPESWGPLISATDNSPVTKIGQVLAYYVIAPSVQENYNTTKIEYKPIIDLFGSS